MKHLTLFLSMIIISLLIMGVSSALAEEESWPGVDVKVVEKYAAQAGRPAREPYINTDQGDLLLFVFAIAGTIGGFVMGYNWRELFGSSSSVHSKPGKTE